MDDVTTGQSSNPELTAYTGPVAGPEYEYVNVTPDNLNVRDTVPNTFLRSGAGNDALDLSGVVGPSTDVLDGATGSNLLVNAPSGTDSDFIDARSAGTTWSTISNFHAGDSLTLWGFAPGVSQLVSTEASDGAPGAQGYTEHFATNGDGAINASVTFAGLTQAQVAGFTTSTGIVDGNSYLYVRAT